MLKVLFTTLHFLCFSSCTGLHIPDTANLIPDTVIQNLKVYVMRDASSNWELANPHNTNICPPYYFILLPAVMYLEVCPPDYGMIGKKGSVKIVY